MRFDVDPRDAPLYVFKTFDSFAEHMDEFVRLALEEGLHGWQVTDCVVTMTKIGYSLADGPPSRRGPMPTARDLQKLTPLVLVQALRARRFDRLRAGLPDRGRGADRRRRPGARRARPARRGGATPSSRGELTVLETALPASRVQELRRELPGLTGGEGVLETEFAGYQPVAGEPPTRQRTRPNPLDLDAYLARVGR